MPIAQRFSPASGGEQLETEWKPRQFSGSELDTEYLERVDPYNAAPEGGSSSSSLNLEYRVLFRETGSFFVQIEYFDSEIGETNYTEAQYINVEPIMVVQG